MYKAVNVYEAVFGACVVGVSDDEVLFVNVYGAADDLVKECSVFLCSFPTANLATSLGL
jgi:hypothetical protein